MGANPSKVRIEFDALAKLKDTTLIEEDDVYISDTIDLDVLRAYWNSGEFSTLQEFLVVVGVPSVRTVNGAYYTFNVVVDETDEFVLPETSEDFTGSIVLASGDVSEAGVFEFIVTRQMIEQLDSNIRKLGVVLTALDGYSNGFITFEDVASEGDAIIIDDGTDTETFVFGTFEIGEIAFTGQANAEAIITIDDGDNDPVAFEFGTGDGLVAPGSSATDSAQNLKAAIEAAVVAGDLDVIVTGATDTLTIKNQAGFTGGSIVETADPGNDISITDFANGVDGIFTGATADESASNLYEVISMAITAEDLGVTASVDGDTVYLFNVAAGFGTIDGSIVDDVDSGEVIVVEDWNTDGLSNPEMTYWAFVAPRRQRG